MVIDCTKNKWHLKIFYSHGRRRGNRWGIRQRGAEREVFFCLWTSQWVECEKSRGWHITVSELINMHWAPNEIWASKEPARLFSTTKTEDPTKNSKWGRKIPPAQNSRIIVITLFLFPWNTGWSFTLRYALTLEFSVLYSMLSSTTTSTTTETNHKYKTLTKWC